MKSIKHILVVLFCIGLTFQAVAGGGWTKKKGTGYFKLSQWWLISDQHFTSTGAIDPNQTMGLFNTSIYAEYGLTDRFTSIVYAPLFSRALFYNQISGTTGEVLTSGEAINSIGDTDITLKYGLIQDKKIVLSSSLMLGLPLGNNSGGSAGNLQTGDGEFNQMIRLDASTSLNIKNLPTFYTIYAGVNNRTNGFSDEFRYGIEAGFLAFDSKVIGVGRLYGIQSFQNGNTNAEGAADT
ncbi:MAG: hypothetical protein ACPGJS_19095, partial [Flammeovirgaceae bacterium]